MSLVSSDTIRSEQHAEIGQLVSSSVGIIIARWSLRAAEEQPQARRVHHEALLDHFTEFLQTLGKSLAAGDVAEASQHCLPAAKHGEQRWHAGWSLPEVIRDYQILRMTLLEFLEESLDRPLRYREILAVGLALDEAIAASVVMYIKDRDQHVARIEQQRIQELEQTQEQLQAHADNLRQADQNKDEFLAILAHELRNPLAPVRHALQVLKLKNVSDPDLRWAADVLERQTQQLARMIDDLTDISAIAHGKVKLEKETVSVGSIFERAVESAQTIITSRKHRLTTTLPADPIWVEADPQRLTQIVVNLLINAAKYTDEGGHIYLSAERRTEEVILKVRDTGIGIPAHLLQHIFEPFAQEHQAENRVHGGLGIGLALVRRLVDLHGGRVEAFSEGRGTGSEFTIYLPASHASASAKAPGKIASSEPVVPRRILVVDDNRDAAHALGFLLKLIGHDVQIAHDGPTALELARANRPEFVLLDIGMPRMDGLEVGRRIRQDLGLTDVLLVALTGYGEDQDRQRTQEAGFNIHLVKPVELNQLYSLLQHLGRESGQGGK